MKKILLTFIFLFSTIFFIDNVEAKTVSYVYNDIEYNFNIDELAQTYGHEATGNYVLTAGSTYFTSNVDIKNFYIVIEIKDSILTLEPNSEDIDTNEIIKNTFYFANVSSSTYKESDSSTLSVKYNLESKEFSIQKNGVGGVGFIGILKTNMSYFYGRTNGELVNSKKYTILKQLIYDYDSLEYFTYNFENGERFIFPKLKDYYFLSSTSDNKYTVTYSDFPATYDTISNSIIYSDKALNINYTNNSDLPYEAYDISYFNSVSYKYDYLFSNYDIYDENGNIVDLIPIPSISITKSNETTVTIENETYISSVTLNTEFSNIDNDKYFYLYKYGSSAEWSQIILEQSSSFTRTFIRNDTFYVQVLDKATNETVSSATYTIDNINYNFKPYIDFVETIPTTCTFYKNGQNYTICKNLNIVAKNLEEGNFIASYSYNATDWTNFENTNLLLNENTTIYFRITNYLTNEISYTSTYTISSIDDDISELGVFNTYSSTYDKDTSFITAYINIYNLIEPIQDNYKIYYSTNSTNFTDITLLLTNMTNYYQYEINNINENITLYFKITDLNNNILYTSTYTINYQIQATENSNFFTNFRTNFHGLSDIISTPLYAIKKINTGVCSSLEIPIPYTNENISLPCMTTVYQNNMPEILNIWQIVTNGLISYYIILELFRIVKSFKEPEEDKIEVVDL